MCKCIATQERPHLCQLQANEEIKVTNGGNNNIKQAIMQVVAYFKELGTIVTFLCIYLFLFGCCLPFFYAFFTRYYWIAVMYSAWWIWDLKTPCQGGRRFDWMRRLKIWGIIREYFDTKMVKTSSDFSTDKNYLFCVFPHGILCYGVQANFCCEANHFAEAFPKFAPYIVSLTLMFWIPIMREILIGIGGIACSEMDIKHVLNGGKGRICVIQPGGVAEILVNTPSRVNIVAKRRKGFIRVALQTGTSLVPVFSFGENEVYSEIGSRYISSLQAKVKSKMGIPLMILKGRGIFQNYFGFLPYRRPITTVVGKPIPVPKIENPSSEDIDKYHQIFIRDLEELFDSYKSQYVKNGSNAKINWV